MLGTRTSAQPFVQPFVSSLVSNPAIGSKNKRRCFSPGRSTAGIGIHTVFFFIYLLILGINAWQVGWAAVLGLAAHFCISVSDPGARKPAFACTRPVPTVWGYLRWRARWAQRNAGASRMPCAQVFVSMVPLLGAISFAVGSTVKQTVDASVFLFVVGGVAPAMPLPAVPQPAHARDAVLC